ncbi:helix-turn-helix domain-containing protein [Patescibacteria group bacterium]|nr:helix-turn-helix domain-containing protein [Patescibacteria group bacterium]
MRVKTADEIARVFGPKVKELRPESGGKPMSYKELSEVTGVSWVHVSSVLCGHSASSYDVASKLATAVRGGRVSASPDSVSFLSRVRQHLDYHDDLDHRWLAEVTGLSRTYVWQLLNAPGLGLSLCYALKLASALRITLGGDLDTVVNEIEPRWPEGTEDSAFQGVEIPPDFGSRLDEMRLRKGLAVAQLSQSTGLSQEYTQEILWGNIRPTAVNAAKLALAVVGAEM